MLARFAIACVLAAAGTAAAEDHPAVGAVQGIVQAFDKHPVVIIAEARHGVVQMGSFYVSLVHDPAFQGAVHDIVIEFASRNNQALLDRYVRGEDIPAAEVRHLWRDTTKVAAWEFPIYAEWLAAIREVNRTLPAARRFRVWAGDTAVDWTRMHTQADWAALGDNNVSFAEVVNQILKEKRRVFVVLGGNHVTKSGDRTGGPNTTTRIEARYPGSTYVVLHHIAPPGTDEVPHLADPHAPALFDLAGTSVGAPALSYGDAWLYVGPSPELKESRPAPGSLESEYMKEVDRRSMIEWGELRGRKFLGDAAAK